MWEIEHDFVDEALQVHRFVLVNRTVLDGLKQPVRRNFDYMIGSGHDGQSCPSCHAPVRMGHVLHEDGAMRDGDGNEVIPRRMALDHLKELNAQHARVKTYTRKHRTRTAAIGE